jgi:hypothetical protein
VLYTGDAVERAEGDEKQGKRLIMDSMLDIFHNVGGSIVSQTEIDSEREEK